MNLKEALKAWENLEHLLMGGGFRSHVLGFPRAHEEIAYHAWREGRAALLRELIGKGVIREDDPFFLQVPAPKA